MTDEAFLNRAYFHAIRNAAMRSLSDACLRFGVDASFATAVMRMPSENLDRMADVSMVLFRPVVSPWAVQKASTATHPVIRAIVAAEQQQRQHKSEPNHE